MLRQGIGLGPKGVKEGKGVEYHQNWHYVINELLVRGNFINIVIHTLPWQDTMDLWDWALR